MSESRVPVSIKLAYGGGIAPFPADHEARLAKLAVAASAGPREIGEKP